MSQISAKRFTLYHFPTSYSSQKVLLALHEKEIPFEPHLVNLFSGQQYAPWYIQLNATGAHVPVLKDGDHIITNPSVIIDYIDRICPTGENLVPDVSSNLGKSVAHFRKKIDNIPMDILTYGVIFHPKLSTSGCKLPGAVQRSMKENFTKRLGVLSELAASNPELLEGYISKSQTAAQKYDIITDEVQVKAELDELEKLFDELEDQVRKISESSGDIADADELWLFGPMFNAADISLSVLLNRITLLGLERRYFPPDGAPYLHSYFQQVQKRPAFKKVEEEIANIRMTVVWQNVKTASPYVLGIAGTTFTVGFMFWIYKKLR